MICHVFWFQEPHYNKKRHNCRPKATLESWAKDWWQASKEKNISHRVSFLSSLVPWSGYSIQIRRENNWNKHATLLPYTMNQIESEKHMRMTWEMHRNTMTYCTTEATSSQHSQPICRQKCQCIKTFMSILDLQSQGRWHILRNASHAWSHLDYLNALKTFCICPKCINTSKRILKQQETQKKVASLVATRAPSQNCKAPKDTQRI